VYTVIRKINLHGSLKFFALIASIIGLLCFWWFNYRVLTSESARGIEVQLEKQNMHLSDKEWESLMDNFLNSHSTDISHTAFMQAFKCFFPILIILLCISVKNQKKRDYDDIVGNNYKTKKTYPSGSPLLINFGENDEPKKNNYEAEKTSELRQKIQQNINAQKEKSMNNSLNVPIAEAVNEDSLYEQALEELDSNNINKATWAKAFADAEGDDSKARAYYIKRRVENLKIEEKRLCDEQERIRQKRCIEEERLRGEQVRISQKSELEKILPKIKEAYIGDHEWGDMLDRSIDKLREYNLDYYLLETMLHLSKLQRNSCIKRYERRGTSFFANRLKRGPGKIAKGAYGIALVAAIDLGMDLEIASKWKKTPSVFPALNGSKLIDVIKNNE